MNNQINKIAGSARRLHQQDIERQEMAKKQEAIDAIVEIQGKLYERASAYMNLMLLAGYAGGFTIWSNSSGNFSQKSNVCIGLSLGLSLTSFILFEVFKMLANALSFIKMRRLIRSKDNPEKFLKDIQRLYHKAMEPKIAYIPFWLITMGVSVSGALFAIGVMFYNYMSVLAGWPKWPA
jgi:hypothetical protein